MMKTDKSCNSYSPRYKNQLDVFMLLSYLVVILSFFAENIKTEFTYLVITTAMVGLIGLIYRIIKKLHLELFDIQSVVFLIIYTICVVTMPFFDMLLFFFSCLLLISMMISMIYCKDEDAKAIAILHVIYIFSCNLVMPCIGMSI